MAKNIHDEAQRILSELMKARQEEGSKLVESYKLDVEAVGKTGIDLEIVELARQVEVGDQNTAASYARQMIAAIKELQAVADITPAEFKKGAQQIINAVLRFADTDPLLSPSGKQEVQRIAQELNQYAARRGGLGSRLKKTTSGLISRKSNEFADSLTSSESFISRGIGRFIKGLGGREERQRSVADIRAGAAGDALRVGQQERGSADFGSAIDRMIRPRNEQGEFAQGGGWENVFKVQHDILQEIRKLRLGEEDRFEKTQTESEIAAETGQDINKPTQTSSISGVTDSKTPIRTKVFEKILDAVPAAKKAHQAYKLFKSLRGLLSLGGGVAGAETAAGAGAATGAGGIGASIAGGLGSLATLGATSVGAAGAGLTAGTALVGGALGYGAGTILDRVTGKRLSKGAGQGFSWLGEKLGLGGWGDAKKMQEEQARLNAMHTARAAQKDIPLPLDVLPQARERVSVPTVASRSAISKQKTFAGQGTSTSPSRVSGGQYETFRQGLESQGITDPNLQNAMIGQATRESNMKVDSKENLNYTSADRIQKVFGRGLKQQGIDPASLVNNPESLAEAVYGHQSKKGKELGNKEPGDGWKYRGRGYIQLTGRSNYAAAGKALGVDLVKNPDLVNDPLIGAQIVGWYANKRGLTKLQGQDPEVILAAATKAVAGNLDFSKGIGKEIYEKGKVGAIMAANYQGPASSRAAGPLADKTAGLSTTKEVAPIVMMAKSAPAAAPSTPFPVPVPTRPRDTSMEAINTIGAV